MKAEYFYKRLLGYESEKELTGKGYKGYEGGCVDIREVGATDEDSFYTIYRSGKVVKELDIEKHDGYTLSDLTGKYELYNPYKNVWTGYFFLDESEHRNTKGMLTRLKRCIECYNRDYNPNVLVLQDFIEEKEELLYRGCSGLDVYVSTMDFVYKENDCRRYYGAKTYPLLPLINDNEVLYVRVADGYENLRFGDVSKIERELRFLKSMLNAEDFKKTNMEGYICV